MSRSKDELCVWFVLQLFSAAEKLGSFFLNTKIHSRYVFVIGDLMKWQKKVCKCVRTVMLHLVALYTIKLSLVGIWWRLSPRMPYIYMLHLTFYEGFIVWLIEYCLTSCEPYVSYIHYYSKWMFVLVATI